MHQSVPIFTCLDIASSLSFCVSICLSIYRPTVRIITSTCMPICLRPLVRESGRMCMPVCSFLCLSIYMPVINTIPIIMCHFICLCPSGLLHGYLSVRTRLSVSVRLCFCMVFPFNAPFLLPWKSLKRPNLSLWSPLTMNESRPKFCVSV